MIKHIVMWKLLDATQAPRFKAELDSCKGLVPGMREFEVATRVDGTCTFLLPCGRIDGDFTRLYVIVDDSQIPQSQSEGWAYTDASPPALELHGQVCADLLSGAKTTVTFSIGCSLP